MYARIDFAKLDLRDALDLAVLIELEAYNRYKMFADQLGHRFAGDAASVFASMAENEAKHGQEIAAKRQELFGDLPTRVSIDDLFDVEAPDAGSPRSNMSPLQAFEIALSSEEKAFAFFDEAIPHVTDSKVLALFKELREEEREHVRMVKEAMAKLPPSAALEVEEDEDELPAL